MEWVYLAAACLVAVGNLLAARSRWGWVAIAASVTLIALGALVPELRGFFPAVLCILVVSSVVAGFLHHRSKAGVDREPS